MLQMIKIRNFALIESAEIPFESGLNILSGETGAGKSIVLDAISLLLGGRANSEVIRSGSDEAVVEGFFDIEKLDWVAKRLQEVGLENGGSDLLIKRSIHRNGKNRIFINGELATLSMLQTVCDGLVDLCGQNEHQSLFKAAVQLDLLDRFSELLKKKEKVREQYLKAIALKDEWEALKQKEEERVQRLEFIRFQIEELNEAKLEPQEDEKLLEEKKLLQTSEQRMGLANQIDSALDGEEGALNSIKAALNKSRSLSQIDSSIEELHQSLERAMAEIEEAARLARHYAQAGDLGNERLVEVQERLSLITNLKRKYGQSIQEMIAHHEKLAGEIDLLENLSSRLESIETLFHKEKDSGVKLAKDLFTQRLKGAEVFSRAVAKELKELRMQDAKVELLLSFEKDIALWGADSLGSEITLEVQTNLGEPQKPIQKIVSGGELSRLMLAIRRVISNHGGIGVYLFDEIDTGLGGQTAFTVGRKLKSVAAFNQVICITHVPQVASFADHHLSIQKHTQKGRTVTEIQVLNAQGRREEVARMLGSEKITQAAIKNAKDLIDSANL